MRVPGWQERLSIWAARRLGTPFEWGDTDCALIVAEAFDVITGAHHAAQHRGRYRNRRQAARYQRRTELDLARGLARAGAFQWPGIALPGDLVLHPHPDGPWQVGHVVLGARCLTANEKNGVFLGYTADALAQPGATVWRIA